jgi:hypothetical protein
MDRSAIKGERQRVAGAICAIGCQLVEIGRIPNHPHVLREMLARALVKPVAVW